MQFQLVRVVLILIGVLTACRETPLQSSAQVLTQTATSPTRTVPLASPNIAPHPSIVQQDKTFSLDAQQAQEVTTLVTLIAAYNAG